MSNPPEQPFPLSWLTIFFKGSAHLVYYITLNLNISASEKNIKNLMRNFGAIRVVIMHAKFQASSFIGVGGEWGDRLTHEVIPNPYSKFLNFPLHFGLGGIIICCLRRFLQIFYPHLISLNPYSLQILFKHFNKANIIWCSN